MVYVLLANGLEEIEALAPVDILRRGGVEVRTVGMTGRTVTGAHGITMEADLLPEEVGEEIELLILPGGIPGADHLHAHPMTDRFLASAKHMAAICAAPYLLGLRGLLTGKQATCYPAERFRAALQDAILSPLPVVTDGNVTTAIGMGAATAFGLELLALLRGRETADRIARDAFLTPNV